MLTRRVLLKSGGLALFAAGAAPAFLSRAALASDSSGQAGRKVLVAVFQRLGMDGLSAVAPYADPGLARLRPQLMLPPPGSGRPGAYLPLDGRFGLHPSFAPLAPLYDRGELAIVHGVGSPHTTRSHPVAQLWWESGVPGDRRQRDGWLNRALAATDDGSRAPLRAVALGGSRPRIFYGDQPVVSVASVDALALRLGEDSRAETLRRELERMYRETEHPLLQAAGCDVFEAMRVLGSVASGPVAHGAYPANSAFAESLAGIARLIRAGVGLQFAFADSRTGGGGRGNWDTHANQGALDGPFASVATDFSASIAAFWEDLGEHRDDVVLVTLTEFGRTVIPNRDLGTEHGRATAMFVLGSKVRGGEVHGTVPERFEPDALEDGEDLPVTTDFRDVLAHLLEAHLGIRDHRAVFPGWDKEGKEGVGPRHALVS
jgi:uncharacterized protein (DUF1501 family)